MVRQQAHRPVVWPLRAVVLGMAMVVFLFLLPLLLLPEEDGAPKAVETPLPTATLPVVEPPAVTAVPGWDGGQSLRLLKPDGTVETLTLGDYLWGVVAAEMPASFQPEALKAQAVAARTYCLYQRDADGDKHPGADVCTDSTCCQAYLTRNQAAAGWGEEAQRYTDKVAQAVSDTDGLLCLYDGAPIDAVFFSSSAGRTSTAMAVWGTEVPYLASVDSPEGEEVPGWQTVVTFTPEEFAARFQAAFPQARLEGSPESWCSELVSDDTGLVTSVCIGGVELSGGQARSVLGLRSAHFTLSATEEEVRLQVTGYGHGVGMSQYGANHMAQAGRDFREILEWYYTGVTVGGMEGQPDP